METRMTQQTKTPTPTQPANAPSPLNETELDQVAAGLLPAVGPAAKPLLPAV
jgi:hypothetical protein